MNIDINKLIEAIGTEHAETILDVLGIKLSSRLATHSDGCEWECDAERKWWTLNGYSLPLTDEYGVRWTCDEASIVEDDVEIFERDGDDEKQLAAWLRDEIATEVGSCSGNVRG